MNVSSLVVNVEPQHLTEGIERLRTSGLCDVFFFDSSGKIIVTVEGKTSEDEMQKMRAIQDLPFVISTALAYSYYGDEHSGSPEGISGSS